MIVDLKFGEGSVKNTLIGNEDMTYSYFGEMCRRNIICGELSHNRCEECFQENLIGTGNSTDETFHFVRTGRHFNKNIIIKMSSTIFKDRASDNIFADNVISCNFSSIINNNDYSGLHEMQYCNIYRTYNTKFFGSGSWLANEINVLQSCEIHVDNLYGCSFGFLQQVKFINSDSATLNIVNMEFNTMIGLPTTIDFASLLPYHLHGTRSLKRLCCAKINTGTSSNTNKIEYTCENIENGEKKILGAYSDDNGETWKALNDNSYCYIITSNDITNVQQSGGTFTTTLSQTLESVILRFKQNLYIDWENEFPDLAVILGTIKVSNLKPTTKLKLDDDTPLYYLFGAVDSSMDFSIVFWQANDTWNLTLLRENLITKENLNLTVEQLELEIADKSKVVANVETTEDTPTLSSIGIDDVPFKVGGGGKLYMHAIQFYITGSTKYNYVYIELFSSSATPFVYNDLLTMGVNNIPCCSNMLSNSGYVANRFGALQNELFIVGCYVNNGQLSQDNERIVVSNVTLTDTVTEV